MTFKATIREIDNAFIVNFVDLSHAEYQEVSVPSFEESIEWTVSKYNQWHPHSTEKPNMITVIVPRSTSSKKFPKASQVTHLHSHQTTSNSSTETGIEPAARYTKLCGLVKKDYDEFLQQFNAKFPGQDSDEVIKLAHCTISKGKLVFVGG